MVSFSVPFNCAVSISTSVCSALFTHMCVSKCAIFHTFSPAWLNVYLKRRQAAFIHHHPFEHILHQNYHCSTNKKTEKRISGISYRRHTIQMRVCNISFGERKTKKNREDREQESEQETVNRERLGLELTGLRTEWMKEIKCWFWILNAWIMKHGVSLRHTHNCYTFNNIIWLRKMNTYICWMKHLFLSLFFVILNFAHTLTYTHTHTHTNIFVKQRPPYIQLKRTHSDRERIGCKKKEVKLSFSRFYSPIVRQAYWPSFALCDFGKDSSFDSFIK